MAAAVSVLLVVLALMAFLPLTLSVFAYAFVEARHRRAWATLPSPMLRLGGGPYRAADVPRPRLERAPLLVRAAALGCFYWSWLCMLAWITIGVAGSERLAIEPLVVVGFAVAVWVARVGVRLLRRDPRVVAFGRRVGAVSVAHATALVVLGFALGGSDWSGPAAVFGVVALAQATLVVLALRVHTPLFAQPHVDAHPGDPLPSWLARMLARRSRNRRKAATVPA
jgi:hypothetical protein